jgi:serine/threonine protein kinase
LPLEANGDAAAKACAKLPAHPTLPRILQTGAVGTSAFVALDFPEGRVVSTMVGDRISLPLVLKVGAQLSDALATIHEQNMVHGELSSDSVLMVPPDRAYLWDMPLVVANRMTDRRGENRLMQNLTRTAAYLAPERAKGSGASMEGDVYSLATVLCVMAGAPLPAASTTLGVVHLVASHTWMPRVPPAIPDPWRGILKRMLSMDLSARPSAREVARVFATDLTHNTKTPTLPEMPLVRLPPGLLRSSGALPAVGASMLRVSAQSNVPPPNAAFDGDSPVVPVNLAEQRRQVTDKLPHAGRPTAAEPTGFDTEVIIPTVDDPALVSDVPWANAAGDEINEVTSSQLISLSGEILVPATEAPPPPPPSALSASVQMTESILVAPDLAQAGAITLTAAELEKLKRPPRWIYVVGVFMGLSIILLLSIAIYLAAKQHGASTSSNLKPPAGHAQVPSTPTPVRALGPVAPVEPDDELSPIRPAAKSAP